MNESETDGTVLLPPTIVREMPASTVERVHCLIVTKPGEQGRFLQIGNGLLTVGRTPPCTLVLPEEVVSRTHCQFQVMGDKAYVTDRGSSNGTFHNGQRLAKDHPVALVENAVVRVGSYAIKYEYRNSRDIELAIGINDDLEKASMYVQALLPPPIQIGDIRTDWFFQPSARVGGDAFGYQHLDHEHFVLYLMDVSGHGAAAALHTVSVMNLLRHRALPDTDFRQPAEVLGKLNAMFQMDDHGGLYFTMWYGVFARSERRLTYSSGGHHPAFLVPVERTSSAPLGTKGLMIGAKPDYRFQSGSVIVPQNAQIYLFSDGVFEITGHDGSQGRLADFLPLLLRSSAKTVGESRRLYDLVRAFARPGGLDDDFSMLVVTFS
jgi:serine phosphatase RsbU (regulator of sigma subunit)